jgi:hypothetical protein
MALDCLWGVYVGVCGGGGETMRPWARAHVHMCMRCT